MNNYAPSEMITTFKPRIYPRARDKVNDVLSGTWVGMGPLVDEFESNLKAYLGADRVVTLSSCTAALEIALFLLNIGSNNGGSSTDEVITTPLTYVATNNSILRAGAVPVFADIENDTYNISPLSIKGKITSRTKAIMVVHLYGHPCDMDEINKLGYPVVEDCAHAFGAEYECRRIGSEDQNIHCFSFQALKNLTTVDGGAIQVPTEAMYTKAVRLRWFGINRDTPSRKTNGTYDLEWVGTSHNMSDLNAAIGLGQMEYFDHDMHRRGLMWDLYNNLLSNNKGITIPTTKDYAVHGMHAYTIRVNDPFFRAKLIEHLRDNDVQSMILYRPHYYYRRWYGGIEGWECSRTQEVYGRILTLPFHMWLTDDDIEYICRLINEFFR